jgi:hypothetical protein
MSFMVVAAISAGTALAGGYMNYVAGNAAAENEKQNAEHNARLMEIRAKDAKRIAENEAGKIRLKGERLKGTQKAATAASGIVLNRGSALDIQRETDEMILDDIETTKTNAALEAWGFKTQATNSLLQGQFNAQALRNQANASLISSIGQAGSSLYSAGAAGKGK